MNNLDSKTQFIAYSLGQSLEQKYNAEIMAAKMNDALDQERIKVSGQIYNGLEEEDPEEEQLELDLDDEDVEVESEEDDVDVDDAVDTEDPDEDSEDD